MKLNIDYHKNNFHIFFSDTKWIEPDDFSEITIFLKSLSLRYNPGTKTWVIPKVRIDEICLWFERHSQEFEFTNRASKEVVNSINELYPRETKTFRSEIFNYFILNDDIELFNFQKVAIDWRLKRNVYPDVFDAGSEKACPLYTKILTPNGWTTIGEIQIDDYVIGLNGDPIKVLGVYPQGLKDIYKVTFSDGCYTQGCDEHLWGYHTDNNILENEKIKISSLKKLMNKGLKTYNGKRKFKLPLHGEVKFNEPDLDSDLPIHPFMLGILISNGWLIRKNIFLSMEQVLKDLSLYEKYSYNKFIPKEYLINSVEKRLHLLLGPFIFMNNYEKGENHGRT